jgi:hypothetical protein
LIGNLERAMQDIFVKSVPKMARALRAILFRPGAKINLEPVWSNVEAKMPDSASSDPGWAMSCEVWNFRTIDTLLILYPHRTMQATTDR